MRDDQARIITIRTVDWVLCTPAASPATPVATNYKQYTTTRYYAVPNIVRYYDNLNKSNTRPRAGFKGVQTGQLPRASTTKGPPEKKTVKNYYLRKHKNSTS